jgi:hypothetical protein
MTKVAVLDDSQGVALKSADAGCDPLGACGQTPRTTGSGRPPGRASGRKSDPATGPVENRRAVAGGFDVVRKRWVIRALHA